MERRHFVGLVGAVTAGSLAGCVSGTPTYENREQFLPGLGVFPNGWKQQSGVNENYEMYSNEDETIFVGFDAEVYEDNGQASDEYKKAYARFGDVNEYDVGEQAFWSVRDDYAVFVFLHGNAVAVTIALKQSGLSVMPDPDRAITYGEKQFDYAQSN